MALWVDRYKAPCGRMLMSHLMADTHEELMDAASTLGLRSAWLQNEGQPTEHFDVCLSKRAEAIRKLGARPITSKQLILYVVRPKREQAV